MFSMARVPLRTNCLQAARWWAEAQIFRSLASPRRPPATTGPHSKMPRETTSALIAAFRLPRGPNISRQAAAWKSRHGPSAHSAQRTRSPRPMRGLWIRHSHRGWRDLRTMDNQEPRPSPAGPIDGNAVAGATKASATIGSVASDSGLSPAAIPPHPSDARRDVADIPLLQRRRPLVTIVARRLR